MIFRLLPLAIGLASLASGASAMDVMSPKNRFSKLELIVEPTGSHIREPYGNLRSFMGALKKAGYTCKGDSYEYGVNISCEGADDQLTIDLEAIPTREPDSLIVEAIHPQGPDGEPLPASEHIAFLNKLFGRTVK